MRLRGVRGVGNTGDMTHDLGPAVDQLLTVARRIGPADLARPTPDDGRSVDQLLGHLVGLTAAFGAAAAKDLGPWTDSDPDADGWPAAEPDWLATLTERGEALVDAWGRPDAWEGMTRAGGIDLPGEVAGLVALSEVTLHGWDLARATGHAYACDEATAQVLLAFSGQFDPAGTPGLYGPALDLPDQAPVFDRVLARTGRDPAWTSG